MSLILLFKKRPFNQIKQEQRRSSSRRLYSSSSLYGSLVSFFCLLEVELHEIKKQSPAADLVNSVQVTAIV